ncbi:MAG TPA: hypothetical protein VGT02_09935 [Methylomirabilota bacterium]|jgi:hypothetical protein|nr:hypothetical protein [Methylomirabilota bacterium]
MSNGTMRKVLEKRQGPVAALVLLVAVVVVLFQPLPAFASCRFTIVSSNIAGLYVGQQITVNPCQYVVSTGTVQATGQATTVQILLQLGQVPSAANQAAVAINPNTGVVTYSNVTTGQAVTLTVSTNGTAPTLASAALAPGQVVGGSPATGTVTLNQAASGEGTAVTLVSADTTAATVPASVTVPAGQTSGPFTATTAAVGADKNVTISATAAGVTKTVTLTVVAARPLSMRLPTNRIVGGGSVQGSVTLTGPAPAEGLAVTLASADPTAATVPVSVTVPAGRTSAPFTASAAVVDADKTVELSATAGGVTKAVKLVVTPLSLAGVGLKPNRVGGGASVMGNVMLNGPAPSGGLTVTLSSADTTAATVSEKVTIGAGQTSAPFTVESKTVKAQKSVVITGSAGGKSKAATLIVEPGPARR